MSGEDLDLEWGGPEPGVGRAQSWSGEGLNLEWGGPEPGVGRA